MPIQDQGSEFQFGARRYDVQLLHPRSLRIRLRCHYGPVMFVDTLDLYSARARMQFAAQCGQKVGCEPQHVDADLDALIIELERRANTALQHAKKPEETLELSAEEKRQALSLLQDPRLIERVMADLDACGIVGEKENKLIGYLACISRFLSQPLAVVIQSSSAAGKSSLMDAILSFVPPEHCIRYSAMTGQSLFYMGQKDLKHKIMALAEEEGVKRASYALKLLQSEGELSIASTSKHPETGKLMTEEYRVEGPVMLFMTTTSIDVDEELLNRAIVLTVSEDGAQTQAIHQRQRESQTLAGLFHKKKQESLTTLHRHAQRLLQPVAVVNDLAPTLSFSSQRTRSRRDHMKYLNLIRAITFLHQYQRPHKTAEKDGMKVSYIETTAKDVEIANRLLPFLMAEDDVPLQTKKLLTAIESYVRSESLKQNAPMRAIRFSRREVCRFFSIGYSQARIHLLRLVEMEYLVAHSQPGRVTHLYEFIGELNEPSVPTAAPRTSLQPAGVSGSSGTLRPPFGGPSGGAVKWTHGHGTPPHGQH